MNPYVELKIKNNIPTIVYYPAEGESRQMTLESENMLDSIMHAAKDLELVNTQAEHSQENFEDLLNIAREADETLATDLPNIDTETIEFRLLETLKPYLESLKALNPDEYSDLKIEESIRAELNKNRNSDIFASFMEGLYSILIAKTLLAAGELGIGNIQLNDEFRNPRLMEKMSKELDKMGLELVITEQV